MVQHTNVFAVVTLSCNPLENREIINYGRFMEIVLNTIAIR